MARQIKFICNLHDHVAGSTEWVYNLLDLARNWGFEKEEISDYVKQLEDLNIIEVMINSRHADNQIGVVRLTGYGMQYVIDYLDCTEFTYQVS